MVSGDERLNLTLNRTLDSSLMLQTNASLFEKNPFHLFTLTKLRELATSGTTAALALLKDQCLDYYN